MFALPQRSRVEQVQAQRYWRIQGCGHCPSQTLLERKAGHLDASKTPAG
jgi:hypothetical protein